MWANALDTPSAIGLEAYVDAKSGELSNIKHDETGETFVTQGIIDHLPPRNEMIRQSPLPEDPKEDGVG